MSLRDRILASDPPLERLRMAVRTLASVALAGVPLLLLVHRGLMPGTSALLGIVVAALASFQANDVEPHARRVTGALLPFVSAATTTISTLLGSIGPLAAAVGFLVIAFPAIWVRRFGPRGFGLGMMAMLSTFFALFIQLRVADLLSTLAAIALGGVASWIAHFVLFPDSAHLALRGAAMAMRARARLAGEARHEAPATRQRASLALTEAAVAVDRLVAGKAFVLDDDARGAIRLTLLEGELMVEDALHDDGGRDIAAVIAAANERVTAAVQRALDAPRDRHADAPMSAAPKPPEIGGLDTATRQALQITLASACAMLIGAAIPPHQYAWALLTAFIVYNGAASASETRRRAVSRLVGTAIGVAIGLACSDAVRGKTTVEVCIAIAGVFVAAYTFRASYLAFTFAITIMIASLYDLAGRPVHELLVARLVETIVGALCAGVIASWVVPFRTSAVVAVVGAAFVEKLRACADVCARSIQRAPDAFPLAAARALDAQLGEFVARAAPLLKPAKPHELHPAIADAIGAAAQARALAGPLSALVVPPDAGSETAALHRAAERLADEIGTAVAPGARASAAGGDQHRNR